MIVSDYLELFKIKQTFLLTFTSIAAYIAASRVVNLYTFFLLLLCNLLTITGTTGMNMYLDSDIDSVMERTKGRPLPSKRVKESKALALSTLLLVTGLVLSAAVNAYFFLAAFLGFVIDIVLYTIMLKRKHPLSVLIGGLAGGMPALGGWAAARNAIELESLLLMLLVCTWSTAHIWSLATYYLDDYTRANIPMLPVVKGVKGGIVASLISITCVYVLTISLWTVNLISPLSLTLASLLLLLILRQGIAAYNISKVNSLRMFKLINLYLLVVMISIITKKFLVF